MTQTGGSGDGYYRVMAVPLIHQPATTKPIGALRFMTFFSFHQGCLLLPDAPSAPASANETPAR